MAGKKLAKERSKSEDLLERCFVISPIRTRGSPERTHADRVWSELLSPALEGLGFEPRRSDHEPWIGHIPTLVIEHLRESRLAVADLTGLRHNCLYEIGIRHAWNLPLILIADLDTEEIFDLSGYKVIKYKLPPTNPDPNSPSDQRAVVEFAAAVQELATHADEALNGADVRPVSSGEFGNSMASLGARHALDAVFKAKIRSLQEFLKVLRRLEARLAGRRTSIPNELIREWSLGVKNAVDELATQKDTFWTIAECESVDSTPRQSCIVLLRKFHKVHELGTHVVTHLDCGTVTSLEGLRDLKNALQKAEQLEHECERRGSSPRR